MFKLKKDVIEKTLNYLAGRPFAEVAGLINELQQAEEIKEEKDGKETKKATK